MSEMEHFNLDFLLDDSFAAAPPDVPNYLEENYWSRPDREYRPAPPPPQPDYDFDIDDYQDFVRPHVNDFPFDRLSRADFREAVDTPSHHQRPGAQGLIPPHAPEPNTVGPQQIRGGCPYRRSRPASPPPPLPVLPRLASPQPSPSLTPSDAISIRDSDESNFDDGMPPTTRARRVNTAAAAAERNGGVVDLTVEASAPGTTRTQTIGQKRRNSSSTIGGSAPKRRTRQTSRQAEEEVEEIDLCNENQSAGDKLLQQQQKDAIKSQQTQEEHGPQRIGNKSCIICMENYTDTTVTACGHIYCHECLTQALFAGEKNSDRGHGSCPVCRRQLSRKKKTDVVPIAFMKQLHFAKNQSKRLDLLA